MIGNLELATSDELFNELQRRFDCMVVAACSDPNAEDRDELFGYGGDVTKCLGLVSRLQYSINADIAEHGKL